MASVPGVSTRAGYTGGQVIEPPTYESVTAGDGHSEAVRVFYNPASTTYEELLSAFFEGHEPRWPVRRKARSVIWYHSEVQRLAAEEALAAQEAAAGRPVHTAIEQAGAWYDAEEWQQQYLAKLEAEQQA